MPANESSSYIAQDSSLPIHSDCVTAPEVYQRAPTLMAGASPGGGGAVRVWAPDRRGLWTATLLSGLGLLTMPTLFLLFDLGFSLVPFLEWCVMLGLMVKGIRALIRPCYITTDDTGIGITTPEGSRSFRWIDIERCDVLMGTDVHLARMIFYVPQRVEADLTGYAPRVSLDLLKIVKEKMNLVPDPDFTHPERYVRASSLRPPPPRVLAPPVVPVIGGIGAAFERDADGRLLVSAVEDGSPAGDAGVMQGDEIKTINRVSAESLDEGSAASECRGPEGALVHLKVSRELWVKELEFLMRTKSPFG